jgi:hypothetical protein
MHGPGAWQAAKSPARRPDYNGRSLPSRSNAEPEYTSGRQLLLLHIATEAVDDDDGADHERND